MRATSETPLHHLGGYDLLTLAERRHEVEALASTLPLTGGKSVFEVGCGAGSFLAMLKELFPPLQVYGMDHVKPLVDIASSRLEGRFAVGDARLLSTVFPEVPAFDCVVSFGMVMYFDSLADAGRVFAAMVRRARACVFLGDVPDNATWAAEERARARTHTAATQEHMTNETVPMHLYIPKSLWLRAGEELNVSVTIMDHATLKLTNPTATYRYSVYVDVRGRDAIAQDMRRVWREHLLPRLSAASTSVVASAERWLAPHFNLTDAGLYVAANLPNKTSRVYAHSTAQLLLAMAKAGIPPVIGCGSLLAVVRGQPLSATDDVDFLAFHRHVDTERLARSLAGMRITKRFGIPAHPGVELRFRSDSNLPALPSIDLFVMTEGHESYALPLWEHGFMTLCTLPGPTEFVPVTYYGWGLPVVFFMSASAVYELQWMYGPDWRVPRPPGSWHWFSSFANANIQFCNVSSQMPRRALRDVPVPMLGVWDLPLQRLSNLSRLYFETDANIRNLQRLVDLTSASS